MIDIEVRLKTPAMGLIAVGVVNLILGTIFGLSFFLSNRPAEFTDDFEKTFYLVGTRVVFACCVLSVLLAPPIIFGALGMMKGKRRTWALSAALLSLLPVTFCANPFGIMFGVWALMVLNSEDVKLYFAER